jgi:hypothetical protein
MTPLKVNSHMAKDLIVSEGDEIIDFELKRMTRIINEMKEDIHEHLNKNQRI